MSSYWVVASQKTTPRRLHEKVCIYCQPTGKDRGEGSLCQSGVPLNTRSAWSLFKEIMHKHRGELQHHNMYRWGHSCSCTVRKHGCTYIKCSKMGKSTPGEENSVYNVGAVYGEISIEPSRLLPPASGSLSRVSPSVLQTILCFSLKRQFWHALESVTGQGWKEPV